MQKQVVIDVYDSLILFTLFSTNPLKYLSVILTIGWKISLTKVKKKIVWLKICIVNFCKIETSHPKHILYSSKIHEYIL